MINRLIVWGGCEGGLESHRHIHRAFNEVANKLGIRSFWVPDTEASRQYLQPGVTVIAADIWGKQIQYVPGVRYVIHNFDGSHPLCQAAPPEALLRLQVYTDDASGEEWDQYRLYNREARTLFQPWGTDVLAEEFMDPVFNALSHDVAFVGAIWGEASPHGELGNIDAINELKAAGASYGLHFVHLTQVPDRVLVETTRAARLAPAFGGGWQVAHNYLPCRVFKNSSYGALMVTNVPAVRKLYQDCHVAGETISELLMHALKLKKKDTEEMIRAQQRVTCHYSYRESLAAIARAFEE